MENAESPKRVWKYLKPTLQSMSCLQRIRAEVSIFLQERWVEHRDLENPHLTLAYLTGVSQDQISQLLIANEGRLQGRGNPSVQKDAFLGRKSEIWFCEKIMNSQSEPHISLFSLWKMTEEDYLRLEKEEVPQLEKKIWSYLGGGQIQIDLEKEYIDIKDL